MTEEQFAADYAKRSGLTRAEYDHFYVTLPCACDDPRCHGWAAVDNNPSAIKSHNDLYAPKPIAREIAMQQDAAQPFIRGKP